MQIILTTVSKKSDATKLAKALVTKKLAVCVNIVKTESSIYRWKGKVVEDKEFLLIIKIQEKNYRAIETFILKFHPYDLPEIVALPVDRVHKEYLNWVRKRS
ncbi:MAG: divalent-cation tolerance protein CutA [Candidatus Micrarchaeota archaeon]